MTRFIRIYVWRTGDYGHAALEIPSQEDNLYKPDLYISYWPEVKTKLPSGVPSLFEVVAGVKAVMPQNYPSDVSDFSKKPADDIVELPETNIYIDGVNKFWKEIILKNDIPYNINSMNCSTVVGLALCAGWLDRFGAYDGKFETVDHAASKAKSKLMRSNRNGTKTYEYVDVDGQRPGLAKKSLIATAAGQMAGIFFPILSASWLLGVATEIHRDFIWTPGLVLSLSRHIKYQGEI